MKPPKRRSSGSHQDALLVDRLPGLVRARDTGARDMGANRGTAVPAGRSSLRPPAAVSAVSGPMRAVCGGGAARAIGSCPAAAACEELRRERPAVTDTPQPELPRRAGRANCASPGRGRGQGRPLTRRRPRALWSTPPMAHLASRSRVPRGRDDRAGPASFRARRPTVPPNQLAAAAGFSEPNVSRYGAGRYHGWGRS